MKNCGYLFVSFAQCGGHLMNFWGIQKDNGIKLSVESTSKIFAQVAKVEITEKIVLSKVIRNRRRNIGLFCVLPQSESSKRQRVNHHFVSL